MMRDILLHLGRLDASGSAADLMLDEDGRLALACRLARTFGARLSALVTHERQMTPVRAMGWAMGPLMVTANRSRQIEIDGLRERFARWADGQGLKDYRFQAVEGDAADSILAQASTTDLIIMAVHDDSNATAQGLCGRVVLGAGVPVLMMPVIGARPLIGRHILVAWNDSREAARALRDGLPLLRRAERVEVVTVTRPSSSGSNGVPTPLIGHLERHGVRRVRSVTLPYDRAIGVGGTLMERARSIGADLVVAGGYGRSWIGEAVSGSTTARMIACCPVPLLLAC